jgi:hypothetical protein
MPTPSPEKQDVSISAAQDAVTIRMHLEQIFAAMQTRELLRS